MILKARKEWGGIQEKVILPGVGGGFHYILHRIT